MVDHQLNQQSGVIDFANAVRDIIGGPFEWCEVPAGTFWMGSDRRQDRCSYVDEPDQSRLELPGFLIARYPITYAQFQTFVDDGIRDKRWWKGLAETYRQPFEQEWKIADHPRENVNWYQAVAFCRWLSARLGGDYGVDRVEDWLIRLPTEAEWEKAARGTDGRIYPWGDDFQPGCANAGIHNRTTPVDSFPEGASPYGALDMSGNVQEWCLSRWTYPFRHSPVQDVDLTIHRMRVLRGGAWFGGEREVRAAYRLNRTPGPRSYNLGFRLCSSGVQPPFPRML